jgi:hypothetical protein
MAMSNSDMKLFAVYLGGRAPRCNTELHDVVFVIGTSIESSYERIMDKWFGDPLRLHLDSWVELDVVDGQRIRLSSKASESSLKLFFVNLGAYLPGQFTELHANMFGVAESAAEVKRRAKSELLRGARPVHTDDLYEVEDCLEVGEVDGFHVQLVPTNEVQNLVPHNGYHVIPRQVVAAYADRRGLRCS